MYLKISWICEDYLQLISDFYRIFVCFILSISSVKKLSQKVYRLIISIHLVQILQIGNKIDGLIIYDL